MIFMGIDPGLTGAVAAVNGDGEIVLCEDLTVMRSGKLAWISAPCIRYAVQRARQGKPMHMLVERSQPMPGQGVSSTFCTGLVMGSILAALENHVPFDVVQANVWKQAMGLVRDKSASLDKARMLFPTAELDRKKDHNRAEALLIAEYARRTFSRSK